MKLHYAAILLAILAPALPTIHADPNLGCTSVVAAQACVVSGSYTSGGGCGNAWGSHSGYDLVVVYTPAGYAYLVGSGACYNYSGTPLHVQQVYGGASTAVASERFFYYDYSIFSYSGCDTFVYGAVTRDLGCPAGPVPQQNWGDLLP